MNLKVLVIGSNGQLGKTLEELSIKHKSIKFTFTTRKELDITSAKDIKNNLSNNFDYCINCAAYTNVEKAESEPEKAKKINADAVKNLAKICKDTNTILIHISTDYVFDGTQTKPYKEDDTTNPINQYGKSKLLGEEYVKQELVAYFIIRTSWLYSKFGNNFPKTIIHKFKKGENLNVIKSQQGTPTSCTDLAEFLIFLIKKRITLYGTYHFSAHGKTTWYDYAIEIAQQLGYSTDNIKPTENFKTIAKRPLYSVLDVSKTQTIFNNIPFWEDSLKKTLTDI